MLDVVAGALAGTTAATLPSTCLERNKKTMQTREIISAAQELSGGLAELHDESILDSLNRLVEALNAEAKLTADGARSAEANLVRVLANRLRVEDYLAQHPEILERPIDRPLFVFGLPRTGTTLVINLLSVDPSRRCFLRWEAFDSVPPPRADELHAGERYEACRAKDEMALKYAPHIAAIHHEYADSPTECQFAMEPSFCTQVFDAQFDIPSYHRWFLDEADYLPAFRYHKRLLQLLQANAPGRWTLKNPWHPLYLNELTTVYPDAQLVMTHRDPVEVVGSACSLIRAVRPMFSDEIDLERIGRDLIETFDRIIERTIAFKEKHGWDAIYDLHYAELMRDPIGQLKKVYEHFGEPFTPEAEAAMSNYMQQNPQGKHGRHTYSLEDYGLTRGQVRDHFRDYCEKFNIPIRP